MLIEAAIRRQIVSLAARFDKKNKTYLKSGFSGYRRQWLKY
jgi:hypothetical protein